MYGCITGHARFFPSTEQGPPYETMFGLGKLFYVIVLSINGIAVLSEDRFLNRIGWGSRAANPQNQFQAQYGAPPGPDDSIKARLVTLISAIRTLLRFPLIFVNILLILYELILG